MSRVGAGVGRRWWRSGSAPAQMVECTPNAGPGVSASEPSLSSTFSRPLTDAERACWLIDQQCPFTIVHIAHVCGPLDPEALRRALDGVTAATPLLRVGVTPGRPPRFRETDRPVPLDVLPRQDEAAWERALAVVRATPMAVDEGPLARLTLVHGQDRSELLLATHHGVSDGVSGVTFVRDLLTALARIQAGEAPELPSRPMRPGVEDLLPAELRGWVGLPSRLRYLLGQLRDLLRRPRKLPEEAQVPVEARVGRTRHTQLDAATSRALIARCRREETTVHGAIVAAALRAIARHLGVSARLGCCTPVNLRPQLCPPLGDELGMFVGPVVHFHTVGPDAALWPLAREVRGALRAAAERRGPAVALATQAALLPAAATPALASRLLYHPLFGALAVTNMGAPDLPLTYGALELERLHIASPTAALGSLVSLAVLTLRGEISVNFNYNQDIISEHVIDNLVALTLGGLEAMAGQRVSDALPERA